MMRPIPFRWINGGMVPLHGHAAAAHEQFVEGEVYTLAPESSRTKRSHDHFFASVHDAWQNLPDHLAMEFPNAEHLRKWALCKAGYGKSVRIACESREEARRTAVTFKAADTYSLIDLHDNVVTVWTAESQSMRAMGKKRFQASKDAVLAELGKLIGADPAEFGRAA